MGLLLLEIVSANRTSLYELVEKPAQRSRARPFTNAATCASASRFPSN
jgi:hypothetical protein